MISKARILLASMFLAGLLLSGCGAPQPQPLIAAPLRGSMAFPTLPPPGQELVPVATPTAGTDPFALLSLEEVFSTLEDLTAIQPYSGWRSSGTEGEREAIDYVEGRLGAMDYLEGLGLALERQEFHVFTATELWDTGLQLTIAGKTVDVPAEGLRGHRDDIGMALRYDSDGQLNDAERDPVVVQGATVAVRTAEEIDQLATADVQDKVLFVDYAAVDRVVLDRSEAMDVAARLLAKEPAGLVLVTRFSNVIGESHGTFVGDVSALSYLEDAPRVPTLYVRWEDLAHAGLSNWVDLAEVESVRLTWDADVFSPATSTNLAARIPGRDGSRALILGAHIDSPNNPGAMDDGSGSAVLTEIARVLDEARVQPPIDLYLVWFGSEELGLYGSYHFASTHQELLDRTVAMLQMDCLLRPLDGIDAYLNLISWSYGRLGDDRLTWADYLRNEAAEQRISVYAGNYYGVESDNSALTGFDVPNANLIFMNHPEMEPIGGPHYAGHMHDPYDTVDLAREMGDVLSQMARITLSAALQTAADAPLLRVAPAPTARALFVGSHTEAVHMSPTTFTDLGMAWAWEGLDVDLVPYGQPLAAGHLEDVDIVVALPVHDYPGVEGNAGLYDEAWSEQEVDLLENYVLQGGLLVMANSGHRLKYSNLVQDVNEDWADVNVLAGRFGVTYGPGLMEETEARTRGRGPLVRGVRALALADGNGVPFEIVDGSILAEAGGAPAAALVEYGKAGGEVLVLSDVGMLGNGGEEPVNLPFWLNLAGYAQSR